MGKRFWRRMRMASGAGPLFVTWTGATSGGPLNLTLNGPLVLDTVGTYNFTFSRAGARIRLRGVAGGGGGFAGLAHDTASRGGGGGGGGA
ncbi:MAG: hypothetical protein ACRD26_19190, partial [Vicinamibacterales bacterium]